MKLRRLFFFSLIALGALVIGACSSGTPAEPTRAMTPGAEKYTSLVGDSANGQARFSGTCSACHGPDGTGIAGLGKDLTTSTWARALTDAELINFLTVGREATDPLNTTGVQMPPRGGNPALSDQDLADIVAYLRSIEK